MSLHTEDEYDDLEDDDQFTSEDSCPVCGRNDFRNNGLFADIEPPLAYCLHKYPERNQLGLRIMCEARICWDCLYADGNTSGLSPNGWLINNEDEEYYCPEHAQEQMRRLNETT